MTNQHGAVTSTDQEDGLGSRPGALRQNPQVWANLGFKTSESGPGKHIGSNDNFLFLQQVPCIAGSQGYCKACDKQQFIPSRSFKQRSEG